MPRKATRKAARRRRRSEKADRVNIQCRLRLDTERRKNAAENDRELDQPHGHFGGGLMAGSGPQATGWQSVYGQRAKMASIKRVTRISTNRVATIRTSKRLTGGGTRLGSATRITPPDRHRQEDDGLRGRLRRPAGKPPQVSAVRVWRLLLPSSATGSTRSPGCAEGNPAPGRHRCRIGFAQRLRAEPLLPARRDTENIVAHPQQLRHRDAEGAGQLLQRR